MQDGKVSPMHVNVITYQQSDNDIDRNRAGQRTEANVSHFRHTCGLTTGNIWGRSEIVNLYRLLVSAIDGIFVL